MRQHLPMTTPLPSTFTSACLCAIFGITLLLPRPEIGAACILLLLASYLFLLHSSEALPPVLAPVPAHSAQQPSSKLAPSAAANLRAMILDAKARKRCELLPAAHDALTASLISEAGFRIAFMSGFAVSATQLAMPDMGLISYHEVLEVGRKICEAAKSVCFIGDGDTGFGSSGNVRRTVEGYARAGFAGITIEDQCYPKRCSYARGVVVVSRAQAVARVAAAIAARDEMRAACGLDLVIVARTDCRNAKFIEGGESCEDLFVEALARCAAFERLGADVVYAEGLHGPTEMKALNQAVNVPTMLAQVERPSEALVGLEEAAGYGYALSLRGLTLLNASLTASKATLAALAAGREPPAELMTAFAALYRQVGFDEAYEWEERFVAIAAGQEDEHSSQVGSTRGRAGVKME